eukprot:gene9827-20439_t
MSQPTTPQPPASNENIQPTSYADGEKAVTGPDFAISQFLLLPDSFGDIYLGELFSAYISVVNGIQEMSFHQVSLAVRLQTTNATHDLYDSRAVKGEPAIGQARTLISNESVDMVVQHTLSDLGTHTLRVTVQYLDNKSNELKPLRKFYRFNVLNPLQIRTVCTDLDMEIIPVTAPSPSHASSIIHPDSMPILLTEEAYSYSFLARKPQGQGPGLCLVSVGLPEVKWCSCMGEHGYVRGEEISTFIAPPSSTGSSSSGMGGVGVSITGRASTGSLNTSTTSVTTVATSSMSSHPPLPPLPSSPNTGVHISIPSELRTVRVVCVEYPRQATVGEELQLQLRVVNDTGRIVNLQLFSKDRDNSSLIDRGSLSALGSTSDSGGLCVSGLSCVDIGAVGVAECRDLPLSIFPLSSGLHALKNIYVLDTITNKEYPSGTLCKIIVYDDVMQEPSFYSNSISSSSSSNCGNGDVNINDKLRNVLAFESKPSLKNIKDISQVACGHFHKMDTVASRTDTFIPVSQ